MFPKSSRHLEITGKEIKWYTSDQILKDQILCKKNNTNSKNLPWQGNDLLIASENPTGKRIFYMLHRSVIQSIPHTTKPTKESNNGPLLNDCIHQPFLQDIERRCQTSVSTNRNRNRRCNTLLLHCLKDWENMNMIALRFACLRFGSTKATLVEHLKYYMEENDKTIFFLTT